MADDTRPDPIARETERILKEQFAAEGIPMVSGMDSERAQEHTESEPYLEGLNDSDIYNADRFAKLHGERIRYVPAWKNWVVWDGFNWIRDPESVRTTELAKDVSRQLFKEIADPDFKIPGGDLKKWTKLATRSASGSGLSSMVNLARGIEGIITEPTEFDTDFWAFGVGNGWIDLRDGTFWQADVSKLMTMHTKVKWNPDAKTPIWDQVLSEWLPDLETRSYFQRLIGMAAVGQVRDHVIVLLHGGGGNGKGTAVRALSKVFGPYYTVPNRSLIVVTKYGAKDEQRSKLFRKRFVVAAETDSGERLNEAQVKELTGGDDIDARGIYQSSFTFTPTHTLFLHTNNLPNVHDIGTGMWRRIRVLTWPTKFEGRKEDKELDEKLEAELEGILTWVIEGAVAWGKQGANEPQAVLDATSEYRSSQDLVEQFFTDMGIEEGTHLAATGKEVTDAWRIWAGERDGISNAGQTLKALLEAHGYEHKPGRPVHWKGFKVPETALGGARPVF